jgi:hyperosmotically inducible protein
MNKNSFIALGVAGCLGLAISICAFADDKNKNDATRDPQNTAINQRDRSGDTKTSGDQSNTAEDTKITAAIRRAIVADNSLTMTATNIKIITANGTVTLRGPVKTAAEKSKVAQIAKQQAGSMKVDNQLEVSNSH